MENLDSILEMSVPDWRIWIWFWKSQFQNEESEFCSGSFQFQNEVSGTIT